MKAGVLIPLFVCLLFTCAATGEAQDPEASVHLSKGRAFLDQGMYEMAINEYKEAIRAEPWYADAHLLLGVAYHCQGSSELAAQEYEKGIKLHTRKSNEAMPFPILRALSLQRAGKVEQAQRLLKEWSGLKGWIKTSAKYLLGVVEESEFLAKGSRENYGAVLANLVAGTNHIVKGDKAKAENFLRFVTDNAEPGHWFYAIARAELERVGKWRETPLSARGVLEQELRVVEVGESDELRDIRTVFVYAVAGERENIHKNLKNYDEISVLDSLEAEKPDVILAFHRRVSSYTVESAGFAIYTPAAGSIYVPGSSRTVQGEIGWGLAFRVKDGNTIRILWQFKQAGKRPSTTFARKFTKLLKKLRKGG